MQLHFLYIFIPINVRFQSILEYLHSVVTHAGDHADAVQHDGDRADAVPHDGDRTGVVLVTVDRVDVAPHAVGLLKKEL